MHVVGRKTRSKTGCRTCRIRKVKCDEEKILVEGKEEPQCRRCSVARILCEWKPGPVPRGPAKSSSRNRRIGSSDSSGLIDLTDGQVLSPLISNSPVAHDSGHGIQAANSLILSNFDRYCLDYVRDSVLVIFLGKHWPWSTVSYTYHKIATKEPMVMSMILATSASEIHRSRLYDCDTVPGSLPIDALSDVDGRMHYGRALSNLREALKQDVKPPEKLEALFITLWLMIDYENRFGSGKSAINVHMRGITTLLFNHVIPSLKNMGSLRIAPNPEDEESANLLPETDNQSPKTTESAESEKISNASAGFDQRLRSTTVPLFLLWTLYFCTPGALFCSPGLARIDANLFRLFLRTELDPQTATLTLPELFRISRQSPSRFWGKEYPATAHLDDLENLPGLTLYHQSHVIQFKITEQFKHGFIKGDSSCCWDQSSFKSLIDEIVTIADDHDTLLFSARAAPSCEIAGDGRRVMETIYWASITYYGTIVYFYLCFGSLIPTGYAEPRWLSCSDAVSQVLELALKLHRSRPRLMARITWPLFMAGIATSDRIYQDWVSIRLRELGRYGQNFTRVSHRFDEIIQGSDPFASGPGHPSDLQQMQEIAIS